MKALQSRQTWVFSSSSRLSSILVHKASISARIAHHLASEELCLANISSDRFKLTSLLRSQSKSKALVHGRLTHTHIVSCGLDHDMIILNCIIQMYGSCGAVTDARAVFNSLENANVYSCNIMINVYTRNGPLDDAKKLFEHMPIRNVVSWNAMIAACVHQGSYEEGLCLFWSMQYHGIVYDSIAFVSALDACAGTFNIEEGRRIHSFVVYVGFEHILIVANAMISFYGKHALVNDAQAVFLKMSHSDIVTWTTILSAFVKVKDGHEALKTFQSMHAKGMEPDKIAHICALDACAMVLESECGQVIHSALVEDSSEADMVASTALISMYGECGNLHNARNVFSRMPLRNVVSWTAMLAALSRTMHSKEALQLFHKMQIEGICPNTVTLVFALDACTRLLSLLDGQDIHMAVVIRGFETDVAISVCLVNLYGKCGHMDAARRVFEKIPHKNVVAWSTMITSCTQNGCGREALSLFYQMQAEGTKPNSVTFLCLVDTCTSLEALEEGRLLDEYICKCGFGKDVLLCNALMNMYRKCGDLHEARMVFDRMAYHNIVSWTALISAYAQMGCGVDALVHFQKMLLEGIDPDSIAFTCILTACCHAGLVDDGSNLFCAMLKDFNIPQTIDHFVCMIDLLGRVGHLDEAGALLCQAPFQNLALPWLCLLGACQSYGDVARGLHAAWSYFELNPQSATPYAMLGNVFTVEDKLIGDVEFMNSVFEEKWCENGYWVVPQAQEVHGHP